MKLSLSIRLTVIQRERFHNEENKSFMHGPNFNSQKKKSDRVYCVFVLASHTTAGSGSTQDREGYIIFVQWLGGHMLPFAK